VTRTILVGEVRTGRRIATIPVSGAAWSVAHRGVGSIDVDIPLNAAEFRKLARNTAGLWRPSGGLRPEFLTSIEPARTFVAVLEGDSVLGAGPIWAHDYDDTTGSLKVKAASSIASIFDHRIVMDVITGTAWAAWAGHLHRAVPGHHRQTPRAAPHDPHRRGPAHRPPCGRNRRQ